MYIYSEIDKIKPIFGIKSPKKMTQDTDSISTVLLIQTLLEPVNCLYMISKQDTKVLESNNICNNTLITM